MHLRLARGLCAASARWWCRARLVHLGAKDSVQQAGDPQAQVLSLHRGALRARARAAATGSQIHI
jgi:hypothetical protein